MKSSYDDDDHHTKYILSKCESNYHRRIYLP